MIGVASCDTSSLSPGLYCSYSDFSKLKKGLSHEISRIFRQTTCTLRGVLTFKVKKGVSHEIFRIFSQRACTVICVSPQSYSILNSKTTFVSLIRVCLIRFRRYLRAQPAHDSSWDTSYLSPRTLLQQICLSRLQKGLSHEIVRIFRQRLAPW